MPRARRADRFTSPDELAAAIAAGQGSPVASSSNPVQGSPQSRQHDAPPLARVAAPPAVAATLPGIQARNLADLPELPTAIGRTLDKRSRLVALRLVAGMSWAESLASIAATPPQKQALVRRFHAIRAAAEWWVRELMAQVAADRRWIAASLVELHGRALAVVPVLGRDGEPTGEYRFDGSTAARCLELLGRDAGMYGAGQGRFSRDDVAELLRAVAERGRPALPGNGAARSLPRTIEHEAPELVQAVDRPRF